MSNTWIAPDQSFISFLNYLIRYFQSGINTRQMTYPAIYELYEKFCIDYSYTPLGKVVLGRFLAGTGVKQLKLFSSQTKKFYVVYEFNTALMQQHLDRFIPDYKELVLVNNFFYLGKRKYQMLIKLIPLYEREEILAKLKVDGGDFTTTNNPVPVDSEDISEGQAVDEIPGQQ